MMTYELIFSDNDWLQVVVSLSSIKKIFFKKHLFYWPILRVMEKSNTDPYKSGLCWETNQDNWTLSSVRLRCNLLSDIELIISGAVCIYLNQYVQFCIIYCLD